jgi:redox-sensing transcriptional repressor
MEEHITARIPARVIDRLPLYVRVLSQISGSERQVVTSSELGDRLVIHPAQIRKDLSYFGHFGRQGHGYDARELLQALVWVLGLDRQWRMALVGVGQLGRAILGYQGFVPEGFWIVEAFDLVARRVGRRIGELTVKDARRLEEALSQNPVDVGIVAVPAQETPGVIAQLATCGVEAVLNYSPAAIHAPPGAHVRSMDPVLVLQSMTFLT